MKKIDAVWTSNLDYLDGFDSLDEPAPNPIPLDVRCGMAQFFRAVGVRPNYSTGIHGGITSGYGRLDHSGFWEYPLEVGI